MANPMDAHRKAQRQKELKKNKQNRQQQRELALVKKDIRPMEAELRELEQGKGDKGKADELRAELTRIRKAKDAHLEKHPDHKRFVYPVDRSAARQEQQERRPQPKAQQKQLYDKDGKLRDPTRSLYYDPVFNPYGVPPPGMPYQERPPTEDELAAFYAQLEEQRRSSSSEDDDDDDDGIAMPAGPPPAGIAIDESSSDSDMDDIAMPSGPPPGAQQRSQPQKQAAHPLPARPSAATIAAASSPATISGAPATISAAPATVSAGPSSGATISGEPTPASSSSSSAKISAAPVLRDLRKEATSFVPRRIARPAQPKATAQAASSARGPAAATNEAEAKQGDEEEEEVEEDKLAKLERADLLGALKAKGLG